MNLWEDRPDVRPLTFHPGSAQAAAELLGVDAVRLWHDQALYKQAGGRATDAHQDHPYWPIKETELGHRVDPVRGSTLRVGRDGLRAGLAPVGLRKFVNIFFGEPEDILADPDVAGIEPVFVEVPKGSVAFHHGLTVHLAERQHAPTATGAVHTIIYFPDGSTRGYPHPHFAVDRAGIEVGEPIASDVTPIAWPRPDGDLPVPPTTDDPTWPAQRSGSVGDAPGGCHVVGPVGAVPVALLGPPRRVRVPARSSTRVAGPLGASSPTVRRARPGLGRRRAGTLSVPPR